MRVIITGGTGLLGRDLTKRLLAAEHEVIVLSRNPKRKAGQLPAGARAEKWDAATGDGWAELITADSAIVNLAGESIAGDGFWFLPERWTEERRRRILQSRLDATIAVVDAVTRAVDKPRVVIQGSATGYYGPDEERTFGESDPPGNDFLANVVRQWEAAASPIADQGVRLVYARTGVVLAREGGALPRLVTPLKFSFISQLGNGRQWLPWIHREDVSRAIHFLLQHEGAAGPFNLTAPEPVRNKAMVKTLGKVLNIPTLLPIPGFVLRLLLGDVTSVVLEGQRAVPRRLVENGFEFKYPGLQEALHALLR